MSRGKPGRQGFMLKSLYGAGRANNNAAGFINLKGPPRGQRHFHE
ncbi:hypothetical protein BEI_0683 [Halomonas beimenensis]|uniref:Uncharacterized protein n=1 Tax=Halomonas beimenensis TaxID=475662 RepID=A0A291P478_9GAMM|nr:hypothetical protein BEI_0683 [Halomonas beimenensis]